jgi:hypothetical protein
MRAVNHLARSISAAALGLLATAALCGHARATEYSGNAVKAAYLYRFAGYVSWPQHAPASAPFTIAVLGAPDIAAELRRLLPGHLINGRVAQVREIAGIHDAGEAQIVYVAPGHTDLVRGWAPQPEAGVLLVTDEDGGLNAGSTLNFLTVDRNVRFEVSLPAAERWGLKISSELLGVATRVQGTGRTPNG